MSKQELDVEILGREFTVACSEDEREGLMKAIHFLEDRMTSIRDGGNIANVEKVAIMTALYLSHELLSGESVEPINVGDAKRRMQTMGEQIDAALETQDKLL